MSHSTYAPGRGCTVHAGATWVEERMLRQVGAHEWACCYTHMCVGVQVHAHVYEHVEEARHVLTPPAVLFEDRKICKSGRGAPSTLPHPCR
eukprot:1132744-Pelagomonas_calceolata.AAC.6